MEYTDTIIKTINKYIADNEESNNLKDIINNYLLYYDIPPIKSFDDFITFMRRHILLNYFFIKLIYKKN